MLGVGHKDKGLYKNNDLFMMKCPSPPHFCPTSSNGPAAVVLTTLYYRNALAVSCFYKIPEDCFCLSLELSTDTLNN